MGTHKLVHLLAPHPHVLQLMALALIVGQLFEALLLLLCREGHDM